MGISAAAPLKYFFTTGGTDDATEECPSVTSCSDAGRETQIKPAEIEHSPASSAEERPILGSGSNVASGVVVPMVSLWLPQGSQTTDRHIPRQDDTSMPDAETLSSSLHQSEHAMVDHERVLLGRPVGESTGRNGHVGNLRPNESDVKNLPDRLDVQGSLLDEIGCRTTRHRSDSGNAAGLLLLTLVELGNGFMFARKRQRSASQILIRYLDLLAVIIFFDVALAEFGQEHTVWPQIWDARGDHENDRPDAEAIENLMPGLRTVDRIRDSYSVLCWVTSTTVLVYAPAIMHKYSFVKPCRGVVFVLTSTPTLGFNVSQLLDSFLDIWAFFVILVLIFSNAMRKKKGLWTTLQPWMNGVALTLVQRVHPIYVPGPPQHRQPQGNIMYYTDQSVPYQTPVQLLYPGLVNYQESAIPALTQNAMAPLDIQLRLRKGNH
ncbi:hypothetical protein BGZ61DRAFT_485659 [Ilyonectria robusta]|uniref:uncharacterized protein n=1 Tax=Ilyonectria robusta TaxID=1079257 RepID=UPI001E8D6A09|nr:uncharacterized protein BGZ61DRAFT_485659 [Ilyonectria robusta]KAH8659673.1 hypothetical protein BGZ61DRAFT_485659 [Ilyonectria robusta]